MKKIKKIFLLVICAVIMGTGITPSIIEASQNILHVEVPHGINSDVNNKWTVGIKCTL